jgi:hypothetical protein
MKIPESCVRGWMNKELLGEWWDGPHSRKSRTQEKDQIRKKVIFLVSSLVFPDLLLSGQFHVATYCIQLSPRHNESSMIKNTNDLVTF